MKFEIHHQTEGVVFDDANGNTVESPRGYWFRIVDQAGTVLAVSEQKYPRRNSVRKVIHEIIDGVGGPSGAHADQVIVDRTDEDS